LAHGPLLVLLNLRALLSSFPQFCTIGDVFDGELNPLTDVGESRLVGLEALTNAFENFVQVDHEGEHEHKPLTLNLHLQLHKRESSTLSTALRERQARAFRAFFQPQDRGIAAQRVHARDPPLTP
jgi:hypothetical protein